MYNNYWKKGMIKMLKLTNVSKYYHSNDVVAQGLRKINLEFKIGEFVAITGESGSGKSTLLNVISGLDTYEDGELFVNGEETSYYSIEDWENYRRQYVGFVFQNYNIIDSYSVFENVMVALQIQGYDEETRKERALELIDRVGLSTHIHHKASKLSGGQKQRAVIARALAKDCPIIVADEPTGNLDQESGEKVMGLLKEISKDKLVIVVTHNYEELSDIATRKIRLFDGEVVEDNKIKEKQVVEDIKDVPAYNMSFLDLIKISFKNLLRTPKRTVFQVIIAIFVSLVFFFSYGAYISATTQSSYTYGGGLIENPFEQRITVVKSDESIFTPSDITTLEDINLVRQVVKDDVLFDLDAYVVFYNEEYGYTDFYTSSFYPLEALNSTTLKSGRLPENANEVVVAKNDEFKVGDKIHVTKDAFYSYDGEEFDYSADDVYEFTVVGVTSVGSGGWGYRLKIYYHTDFLNSDFASKNAYINAYSYESFVSYNLKYLDTDTSILISLLDLNINTIEIDNGLADNEISINSELLSYVAYSIPGVVVNDEVTDPNWMLTTQMQLHKTSNYDSTMYTINFTKENTDNYDSLAMNQTTYDLIFIEQSRQAAVIVDGLYEGKKVVSELEELGYRVIYPSSIPSSEESILQLISKIGLGAIMLALLVVVYFISYVVLKNVQTAKKKDFLIFRSIGASKKNLYKITILELVMVMITGFLITLLLLIINKNINTFIPDYLKYFDVIGYMIIALMLILLGVMLGNRFNKRIFDRSVITSLKEE